MLLIKKRYVKAGCYVELQDLLPQLFWYGNENPAPATSRWLYELREASILAGRRLDAARKYKDWLKEAGFVNVEQSVLKVPMNGWSEEDRNDRIIGVMQHSNLLQGLRGFSLQLLIRYGGWRLEELEFFLYEVKKELQDRSIRAYWKLYVYMHPCVTPLTNASK